MINKVGTVFMYICYNDFMGYSGAIIYIFNGFLP